MHPLLTHPTETLAIVPLPDGSVDRLGIDPRSPYVEEFWLGILGPSATWLARRLADRFDDEPAGFELPLSETARWLGLGDRGGRHSPFLRAVNRLVMFDFAQAVGPCRLAVRRYVPAMTPRHLARLGPERTALHEAWTAAGVEADRAPEDQRRRSRQLALSLLELGEGRDATERQLLRWQYPPPVASEAAAWAWARHRTARAAVAAGAS